MSYQPVPALGKDWLTPFFDMLLAVVGLGDAFKERVLEKARIQPDERLLDVGCGTATLLLAAKSRYPTLSAIGIDSDERVLALARKKIQRKGLEVEVMQARAEALPFDSSSFDVVVSTLIFHHLPTEIKKQAMREIHRVLRSGGRFLLADFAKPQGLVLTVVFAFATLMGSDEIQYLQDNKAGKPPLFLEEAGFAVQELLPRYKGVQFLLATKEALLSLASGHDRS